MTPKYGFEIILLSRKVYKNTKEFISIHKVNKII
jgi:hypothetical protein